MTLTTCWLLSIIIIGSLMLVFSDALSKSTQRQRTKKRYCLRAFRCVHNKGNGRCGLDKNTGEVRWFLDVCDISEFNCEYKTDFELVPRINCQHVPTIRTRDRR